MKVTLDGIKAKIKGETYLVLPDGRTTLCQLELQNGYTINGLSACVDPKEFDRDLGRKYAFEDAIRQIWPLEGYLLAENMYFGRNFGKSAKAEVLAEAQKQFNNELRKHVDLQTAPKKKLHWTQTIAGKRKLAARKKGARK
jgi:hypothetical protein